MAEKELTGWDKVGAAVRKRTAVSAHTGRKPLTPKVLNFLRDGIVEPGAAKPKDWVALRPSKEELLK